MVLIQQWLNSKRDYAAGILLYEALDSCDLDILTLLKKGRTNFSAKKLFDLLLAAHKGEKPVKKTQDPAHTASFVTKKELPIPVEVLNDELLQACKYEADMAYKECMNKRALLMSLVPADEMDDANRPDLVEQRKKLALEVLQEYKQVSKLYDKADFVKKHGRLPDQPDQNPEIDIPDIEVKSALDNARKAYNKLKNKEQTPERIALMQLHQEKIKNLSARWDSLKQAK
jgi:hypothetical protein